MPIAAGLNAERHVLGDLNLAGQTTEVAPAQEGVEPVLWIIRPLFYLYSAGGAVALSVTVHVLGHPSVRGQIVLSEDRSKRSAMLDFQFVPFAAVVYSDGMRCVRTTALDSILFSSSGC